ncbi:hypothetical protein M434DRAFT_393220 [Hypoxylon sp. CO27-5]|nr:hypothetical protein M434DRAFT_393220 [Hypoxylon sp. CO27-5]
MEMQLTTAEANQSRQPNLIALCTILLVSSTLALSLRLWSNYVTPFYHWGWDDFFAAMTLPFTFAENGFILWWIGHGLGKHAVTVPPVDLAKGPKIVFFASLMNDFNISFPKFSVLFFYHRIFARTSKWFSIAVWTVGIMNVAWLVSALGSTIFQCTPVNAAWETVPGSTCISQWGFWFGTAVPSTVIDLFILLMPMPLLWGLQAPVSRRIMVSVVFVCGYSVIVASIGRLVALARAGPHMFDDLTWTTIGYVQWVQCEGPISLVSVCLPNIFRFVKRVHEKGVKGTLPDSRGGSNMLSPSANGHHKGQFIRMEDYPSHLSVKEERRHESIPKSEVQENNHLP